MRESEAIELSWLSLAYMEAGIFLAEAIVNDELSDSEHKTLVPLFLIHQALELLYKSALRAKGIQCRNTHNLRSLRVQFAQHFPELDFDVPDVVLAPERLNEELFPEISLPLIVQHERLRYPTNKDGHPWGVSEPINLKESIDSIVALNRPAIQTWLRIRKILTS